MSPLLPQITPATAGQRLQNDGLLALGLTAPLLSSLWFNAAPTFDAGALTLKVTQGGMRTPFTGIRTWVSDLSVAGISEVSGLPPAAKSAGAVVRLHPQAAARLDRLVASHLGSAIHPVPHAMLMRCQTDAKTTAQTFVVGEALDPDPGDSLIVSFHDERGLIIDPIAVAALFVDLFGAWPALAGTQGVSNAPGSVTLIAGMAPGTPRTMVQVVDAHGAPFRPAGGKVAPVQIDAQSNVVAISPTGMLQLTDAGGVALDKIAVDPALGAWPAGLRIGWARNSTLDRVPLVAPVPGATLTRQFLRVCAVDLDWHLLGNRSAAAINDVPPSDDQFLTGFGPVVSDLGPVVRDRVAVTYYADGVDVLAAAGQVLAPTTNPWTGLAYAVSPVIDANVGLPAAPGPGGHWPAFPPAPVPPPAPPFAANATGLTAAWSNPRDVVLTFPGTTISVGSHVRVYPQVFQKIASIGDDPSFLRGDGVAAIVVDTAPFSVALVNPLGLDDSVNQPPGSMLVIDIVVSGRAGQTLTFGNIGVPIANAFAPAAGPDQFGTAQPLLAGGAVLRAIAPSPVFGMPAPPPPAGPQNLVALARSFANEGDPRTGPRLPTMARFPTLVVVGTGPASAPLSWDAVVSGGRWSRETRSTDHARGNPGNPAGPDIHTAGVRVGGAAAYDVAQIALRRTTPLLPGVSNQAPLGWLPVVAGTSWVAPPEPPTGGPPVPTGAAAVLHTVARGCDTPELATIASITGIPAANTTAQTLVDAVAGALNLPSPTVSVQNQAQVVRELRREFATNLVGRRDAQWALRRAFAQARDLVFVCSPQFSATSHPTPSSADPTVAIPAAPHEVDLVEELRLRMVAQPSLLALICIPRWPDADPRYGGWIRQAFEARNLAVGKLKGVDPDRVVVFHPSGFPGRHVAIRSTVVIVDDVWALVGSSHLRRRGMTFDEGVDVASFDRALDSGGASTSIRAYRRALLARLTGVQPPAAGTTGADWSRLAGTRSCFDLVGDLVGHAGLGRLAPFWGGPADQKVLAQTDIVADPDGGRIAADFALTLAGMIGESPAP